MIDIKKYNKKVITLLIFIVIISLRIPYLNNSPYEYHAWRQSDTEAIARNFIEQKFNIFYPQLNYDGPAPNYVQLELQVTTFLIALLYKIFGYRYFLARLVPLLFFMGSALYLFLICKKVYALPAAWLALILYGIFPLNIFISRAIMPESAALFFYTGAFYYFLLWRESENIITLFYSALFTALAVATKVPAVFIGIPMLYIAWHKYGIRFLFSAKLWFFAALSLGLPLLYFSWLHVVAQTDYVTGIAFQQVMPNLLHAVFTNEAHMFFSKSLPRSYTTWGLLLAIIGLLSLRRSKEITLLFWALALLVQMVVVVSVIRLDYYLIFLGPLLAMLGANVLQRLAGCMSGLVLIALICFTVFFTGWQNTNMDYKEKEYIFQYAEIIKKYTAPDDLIVIGTNEPLLLNSSCRKGWRANLLNNTRDEINYYISNGAKYFFPVNGTVYIDNNDYIKYLEANFNKITVEEGYTFFILEK